MKEIFRLPSKGRPIVTGFDQGNNNCINQYNARGFIQNAIKGDHFPWSRPGKIISPLDGWTAALSAEFLMKEEQQIMDKLISHILQTDGKPTIFLPFIGEFGWRCLWHIPMVNLSTASYKIVCCQPGQEVLYPSANEYYYNWVDPFPDSVKEGTDRHDREWPDIRVHYYKIRPPNDRNALWVYMQAGGLSIEDERIAPMISTSDLKLKPRFTRNLKVDICIATRHRAIQPEKNYPHWQQIADWITRHGLTFAVIGDRNTSSPPLNGQMYQSGDRTLKSDYGVYPDMSDGIELLQNCKLFLGTESGGAHLAALCGGCDIACLMVHPSFRMFINSMERRTDYKVHAIPFSEWNRPEAFIEIIKQKFNIK